MAGQGSINFVKGMKRMATIVGRSDYFATSFLPSFLPISYNIYKKENGRVLLQVSSVPHDGAGETCLFCVIIFIINILNYI